MTIADILLAEGSGVGVDPIFGWSPVQWLWIVVVAIILIVLFGMLTRRFRGP